MTQLPEHRRCGPLEVLLVDEPAQIAALLLPNATKSG
jgi:hypothetical protein